MLLILSRYNSVRDTEHTGEQYQNIAKNADPPGKATLQAQTQVGTFIPQMNCFQSARRTCI